MWCMLALLGEVHESRVSVSTVFEIRSGMQDLVNPTFSTVLIRIRLPYSRS